MATMNISLPDQMKIWVEEQAQGDDTGMPATMFVT